MTRDFLLGFFCGVLVTAVVAIVVQPARAHDHPITGKRNAAGEWCCGEGDCFVIPESSIRLTNEGSAWGYLLYDTEFVPVTESMPSPDGQFWRCKRPDGSRRCFFAPPPNS